MSKNRQFTPVLLRFSQAAWDGQKFDNYPDFAALIPSRYASPKSRN
jgi:hypothetical protein